VSVDNTTPHAEYPAILGSAAAMGAAGSILLSAGPAIIVAAGGSTTLAGAVTATFMAATVVAQLATVKLLRYLGYSVVLMVGVALLGIPSLIGLLDIDPVWWHLIAVLRGIGFGVMTVVTTALPPLLASPAILSRVTGTQGLVAGSALALGLTGGIALHELFGATTVLIVSTIVPLVGLAGYPSLRRHRNTSDESTHRFMPQRSGRRPLLVACLAQAGAGAAYGAVTTLVPIHSALPAYLLLCVLSFSMTTTRYATGLLAQRSGSAGRHLRVALMMGALGLVLLAAPLQAAALASVIGALLFGAAFGIVQTDTVLLCYAACGPQDGTAASVWWNLSVDAASGVGAVAFAALAAARGFPSAFVAAALTVAACVLLPLTAIRKSVAAQGDGGHPGPVS